MTFQSHHFKKPLYEHSYFKVLSYDSNSIYFYIFLYKTLCGYSGLSGVPGMVVRGHWDGQHARESSVGRVVAAPHSLRACEHPARSYKNY